MFMSVSSYRNSDLGAPWQCGPWDPGSAADRARNPSKGQNKWDPFHMKMFGKSSSAQWNTAEFSSRQQQTSSVASVTWRPLDCSWACWESSWLLILCRTSGEWNDTFLPVYRCSCSCRYGGKRAGPVHFVVLEAFMNNSVSEYKLHIEWIHNRY